ncbi:hypothetical protein [Chondrinema litorale]|uniref:hypothetical protein n=1 Tax=Chondrinema litorale TaxID=2994555 RepID=UPI0025434172|nr:hypothetical protein [Chondrinema litorale]UZR96784.1 hypothetical protein OQ292_24090 [Chondrinema litorale]
MKIDPILRLKGFLSDPINPAWSSQGLIDMFSDLNGNMKEKQLTILPIIDNEFSLHNCAMSNMQYHFLRAITLHTFYPQTRVTFSTKDMEWLLDKFDQKQTQQRAALIIMTLKFEALSEQRKQWIKQLLKGTLADQDWSE